MLLQKTPKVTIRKVMKVATPGGTSLSPATKKSLIGEVTESGKKRGRPSKAEVAQREKERQEAIARGEPDPELKRKRRKPPKLADGASSEEETKEEKKKRKKEEREEKKLLQTLLFLSFLLLSFLLFLFSFLLTAGTICQLWRFSPLSLQLWVGFPSSDCLLSLFLPLSNLSLARSSPLLSTLSHLANQALLCCRWQARPPWRCHLHHLPDRHLRSLLQKLHFWRLLLFPM